MRLLLVVLALGACAAPRASEPLPADVFLADLLLTPAERCAEAKKILATLGDAPPADLRRYRLYALTACAES